MADLVKSHSFDTYSAGLAACYVITVRWTCLTLLSVPNWSLLVTDFALLRCLI